VSNRWGGFKALRARWLDHLGSASRRPVVLIDEAQEMTPMVLSELRLWRVLGSTRRRCCAWCSAAMGAFSINSGARISSPWVRIRTRLATGAATRDELLTFLEHLLATAGNAGLMTKELRHLLCDHAAGNYRILIGMRRTCS